jgi:CRP-like cAMP-binding protein
MASAVFLDLAPRLGRKLAAFAKHFGVEHKGGVRIDLRLSQSDLGAMLGASRESVNRQLRSWVKAGLLSYEDRRITVRDIDDLNRIARQQP